MIKRKEIWIFDPEGVMKIEPSDCVAFYCDDIYGDVYKNKKDYWELVEDEK